MINRGVQLAKAAVGQLGAASEYAQSVGDQALTSALATFYRRGSMRPFSLGYSQFRGQSIGAALRDESLLAAMREGRVLPQGYGYRLDARMIEIPWVCARVAASGPGRLLDAGSSLNFRYVVAAPLLASQKIHVTTLAPERRAFWKLGVSYIYGDLRELVLRDGVFDSVSCISTIEHVGMDNERYAGAASEALRGQPTEFLQAVDELKRVLKPGGSLYVTFPFGRYEDHGWFQQFDAALADRLIERFAPVQACENVYRYFAEGWRLSSREQCADCEFFDVQASKYFKAGSTLDFPPHYPAGEGAVMCLQLVK